MENDRRVRQPDRLIAIFMVRVASQIECERKIGEAGAMTTICEYEYSPPGDRNAN